MLLKKKFLMGVSTLAIASIVIAGCGAKDKSKDVNTMSSKEQKVIKVGTTGQYEPFTFMKDDKLTGFEIDVWEEIAKRSNYKLEWVISDFKGMFGSLDIGKIDTAAHQIDVTERRKAKYKFTETYAYNPIMFVVREDDNSIKTVKDLYGKKLGVSAADNALDMVKSADKEGKINVVVMEGGDKSKLVEQGKIDAHLLAKPSALSAIKKGNYKVKIVDGNFYCEVNAYPFNKEKMDKEKFESVNKAIKSMHEDGTLTKISEKWFSGDITKK